jgi:hypothetical protein
MEPDPDRPPTSFPLPSLSPALDAWFAFAADLADDTELIHDGVILDGLRVTDEPAAREALAGYRFVVEDDAWADRAGRGWDENWIVLDAMNGDPIVVDVSTGEVSALEDPDGTGSWRRRLVAASVPAFVDAIERVDDVPGPPPIDDPAPWSVWAVDLGPEPLKTLLGLERWPLFETFTRSELLAMRSRLPARVSDGLDEDGARSCVEFAAGYGATFEARTYLRGGEGALDGVDLDGLWLDNPQADAGYAEPAPSDQLIASVEAELGFRLPDAYIALSRIRNGGVLARGTHPMAAPTGWADDHIAVTGIYAIGRTARYALCGELGSAFMRDEWGYPDWGVGFADTPTAGHEQLMLDYRACGPDGEPAVVYVDQEDDYSVHPVAPDFATFLQGLDDRD